MKKVVLVNISIIFFVIAIAVLSFEIYAFYTTKQHNKNLGNLDIKYSREMHSYQDFYRYFKKNLIRPIENKNSELNPILIFGCSYAYGQNIKEDETFSHHIAKYVKNPVYNFASGGWSIANTLYQTQKEPMLQQLKKEPVYVIYVYTPVQFHRMYLHVYDSGDNHLTVHYDYKNGKLKEINPSLALYSFYSVKKIDNAIAMYKMNSGNYIKNQEILTAFFKETLKEFKKYWKNTKYYILVYENEKDSYMENIGQETEWEIINLSEIVNIDIYNPKYTVSNTDKHPNKNAWDLITKPFLKKIGAL